MSRSEEAETRPLIFEYNSISAFIAAMLAWNRQEDSDFSIRREVARVGGISHTQVSRLSSGKRRLTRDLVEPLARCLLLTGDERVYLDRWVKSDRKPLVKDPPKSEPSPVQRKRRSQNHLLHDWLNVYVRDAVKLKDFKPDVMQIYRLLGGIASPRRIERALGFLLREGFLRRTLDGNLVQDEVLVTSSDGPPSAKVRAFHKQALALARRGLDVFPVEKRQQRSLVMHLNKESVAELEQIFKEFYERLLQFAEERPNDNEGLYQIVLNFIPISISTKN